MKAIVFSVLAACAAVRSPAPQDNRQPKPAAAGQSPDYPGRVAIFNGKNFDGWEADPSTWKVVDGAMRGEGGTSRLAFTAGPPRVLPPRRRILTDAV